MSEFNSSDDLALWEKDTEFITQDFYYERTLPVEAQQHDGSAHMAEFIRDWIRATYPSDVLAPGAHNNDDFTHYVGVKISSGGFVYVGHGDWVVRTPFNQFFFFKDKEFKKKYMKARDEDGIID